MYMSMYKHSNQRSVANNLFLWLYVCFNSTISCILLNLSPLVLIFFFQKRLSVVSINLLLNL